MRLVLLVASVLAVANGISLFDYTISQEWGEYKLQYDKSYTTKQEELLRMRIYAQNRNIIAQHNQRFQLGLESYEMGVNQFTDLLHEEFAEMMLTFPSNATERQASEDEESAISWIPPSDDVVLPLTVDWRSSNAVTRVKDQGYCGSCWAFSTTGALEAQVFFKTKKLVGLSEQNLVDCSREPPNKGCGGGLMGQAYDHIKNNGGIQTEQSYPYRAVQQQCKFNPRYVAAKVRGYTRIPSGDEKALMKAVAIHGPVAVTIDASIPSFQRYRSGVYYERKCNPDYRTHAVVVVGYGTSNSQDYWLVKNSWDVTWGDRGYIKMARNRNNNCGISSYAMYPVV